MRTFTAWMRLREATAQGDFSGPNPYMDPDTGQIHDEQKYRQWENDKKNALSAQKAQAMGSIAKLPDGRLVKQDDVYNHAWDEIGQLLMNNANGFAANKISDPWKQHMGFRTAAINILKKYGLDKDRAAVDKIFGPQGLYYQGGGGLRGNPLAFIRKKIADPTAFGAGQPQGQAAQTPPSASPSQFPSQAQAETPPQQGFLGKLAGGLKNFFGG